MTRILLTNDDAIFSEGIKLLAASLATLADVVSDETWEFFVSYTQADCTRVMHDYVAHR